MLLAALLRPPSAETLVKALIDFESSLNAASEDHSSAIIADADADADADAEAIVHRSLKAFSYPHTYLNHGADGCPSASVLSLRSFITRVCYAQPMVYHRSLVPILVNRAKEAACKYLKIQESLEESQVESGVESSASKISFSFLPSVSQGLFAVLQSITWEKVRAWRIVKT